MCFFRKSMFYHILKNKSEHGMSKKSSTTIFFRLVTNLKRQDTFVRCEMIAVDEEMLNKLHHRLTAQIVHYKKKVI